MRCSSNRSTARVFFEMDLMIKKPDLEKFIPDLEMFQLEMLIYFCLCFMNQI